MSNPYFSVGEEVILASIKRPEFNGDHIVEKVFADGDAVFENRDNIYLSDGTAYYLEGLHCENTEGYRLTWAQKTLRKKHKPSTDSFTEMMSNINELVTQ